MHTKSRPDTLPTTQHHPGMTLSDISPADYGLRLQRHKQVPDQSVESWIISGRTVHARIDTDKAAKCQGSLIPY